MDGFRGMIHCQDVLSETVATPSLIIIHFCSREINVVHMHHLNQLTDTSTGGSLFLKMQGEVVLEKWE